MLTMRLASVSMALVGKSGCLSYTFRTQTPVQALKAAGPLGSGRDCVHSWQLSSLALHLLIKSAGRPHLSYSK